MVNGHFRGLMVKLMVSWSIGVMMESNHQELNKVMSHVGHHEWKRKFCKKVLNDVFKCFVASTSNNALKKLKRTSGSYPHSKEVNLAHKRKKYKGEIHWHSSILLPSSSPLPLARKTSFLALIGKTL